MTTFYRVKTLNDLIAHLQSTHNEIMEVKEENFNNLDESEEVANDSQLFKNVHPRMHLYGTILL